MLVAALAGCRTGPRSPSPAPSDTRATPGEPDPIDPALVEGYGLLHELLDKQADVDKILLIKSAPKATRELIGEIARFSRDSRNELRRLAEAESAAAIPLDRTGLPAMERAARDRIESRTARALLMAGDSFEFDLLRTQVEALGYAGALAAAMVQREAHDNRVAYLEKLRDRATELHDRVVSRLHTLTTN